MRLNTPPRGCQLNVCSATWCFADPAIQICAKNGLGRDKLDPGSSAMVKRSGSEASPFRLPATAAFFTRLCHVDLQATAIKVLIIQRIDGILGI